MRDILLTLVIFGSIPLILKRPYVGIVMWCFLSYMNPHRMTWGFAYNMPFAALVAGATFISLIKSNEPKRIPLSPITVLLVFFLVWMTFSTTLALYYDDAVWMYKRVFKIQLMNFVTLMIMVGRKRIEILVWAIVVSLGFFGVKGGVYTIVTAGSGRVWGPPGSFVEDNNTLALALLMLVPLANYLRMIAVDNRVRRVLAVSILLMVAAIVGSQSRGAFVGGLAMLFYMWIKSKSKFATAVMGIFLMALIYAFMPQSWHDRMSSIKDYRNDPSAMGRINAWWEAYNVAKDRLTGGGYGQWTKETFALYAPNPADVHDAHSIYFEALGEHGFVGLLLFLAIGIFSLRTANWNIKHTANIDELKWANDLSRMVFVSIIAYAAGGAFLGLAYFDLYYHLIALLLLTQQAVKHHLTQPDALDGKSASIKPKPPVREFVRTGKK